MAPYGERKGQILFEGRELDTVSVREQGARIGYVLQSPDNQLVTDKVWHELAFGLENLGYETGTIRLRVAEMASFFGIQTWFEKSVEELSGGQKQLLNLAAVMAMQPDLLVLDEPTSQLDPLAAGDFLATLRKINAELGTTILLIEHRLEEVLAYADRVLVMENGGILALDAPEKLPSLIRDNDMFQAMPVPMRIFEELSGEGDSPVTVREGREWLEEWREEKKTSENSCKNQAETVEKMSDDRDRESAEKLSDTQESETVDTPEKGRKISLFGLFSKESAKGSDDQQPQTVLEARDVWFRYEKELPDVVRDLNLKVQKVNCTVCSAATEPGRVRHAPPGTDQEALSRQTLSKRKGTGNLPGERTLWKTSRYPPAESAESVCQGYGRKRPAGDVRGYRTPAGCHRKDRDQASAGKSPV